MNARCFKACLAVVRDQDIQQPLTGLVGSSRGMLSVLPTIKKMGHPWLSPAISGDRGCHLFCVDLKDLFIILLALRRAVGKWWLCK